MASQKFSTATSVSCLQIFGIAVVLSLTSSQLALGQGTTATKPKPAKKNAPVIPDPEPLQLATKDGVQLKCTYFSPAMPEGSEVDGWKIIPYLVLHDWGSSRNDVKLFARFLQMQGNAVLIPDLRGHGESTVLAGSDKDLDYDKFRKNEIESVWRDLECCKKQLVQLNNERKLNIDMLVVVAVGKTVPIATTWVIRDWFQFAPLNKDGIKQAQDVKMLVMVSPEKKNGSFNMTKLLGNKLFSGERALPTIVVWGPGSDEAKDAESIFKKLEKSRPDAEDIAKDKVSLFPARVPGSMSGRQILADQRAAKFWLGIHQISSAKILQVADELPWQDRSSKK